MQGRVGHRRAGHADRIDHGHGRHRAHPPHAPNYLAHDRRHLLGRKFIGNVAARRFTDHAQAVKLRILHDDDHRAVDPIVEADAFFFDLPVKSLNLLKRATRR